MKRGIYLTGLIVILLLILFLLLYNNSKKNEEGLNSILDIFNLKWLAGLESVQNAYGNSDGWVPKKLEPIDEEKKGCVLYHYSPDAEKGSSTNEGLTVNNIGRDEIAKIIDENPNDNLVPIVRGEIYVLEINGKIEMKTWNNDVSLEDIMKKVDELCRSPIPRPEPYENPKTKKECNLFVRVVDEEGNLITRDVRVKGDGNNFERDVYGNEVSFIVKDSKYWVFVEADRYVGENGLTKTGIKHYTPPKNCYVYNPGITIKLKKQKINEKLPSLIKDSVKNKREQKICEWEGEPCVDSSGSFGCCGINECLPPPNEEQVLNKLKKSSVRVKINGPIKDPSGKIINADGWGSGTIISNKNGVHSILTAGHIFIEHLEVSEQDRKKDVITVSFYDENKQRTDTKEVYLSYINLKSDIAVLTYSGDDEYIPITKENYEFVRNEDIYSIGFGGINENLEMNIRKGKIETTGICDYLLNSKNERLISSLPEEAGRSGGGLFDRCGNLIGMTEAVFVKSPKGIYIMPKDIQDELKKLKLYELILILI